MTGRGTLALVVGLVAAKVAVHLAVIGRYGYHGDELYFIECGRHLAFGYVDHPPLVPWIARLADELGGGLVVLRLPVILAGAGTMVFAALLVKEWGGGWFAQLLALLSILVAPAFLRMGAMLCIPAIELCLCAAATYLAARALGRGERWTWLALGAVVGVGLLTKHTVAMWAGGLFVGLLATEHRRVLATPWPWAGLLLAALLFVPNLVWQAQHGWPTLEFSQNLREDLAEQQGRGLFVLGQLLYFHPVAAAIWMAGLVFAFTGAGRAARPFAVLYVAMFAALLALGGKPYYLVGAYPALFAAGGVALERWLRDRARVRAAAAGLLGVTGAAMALVTIPLLPIETVDAVMGRLFGWAVPPMALTHDLHGMYGWPEHAATMDRVVASLSPEERRRAAILTGSYSQAAALNLFRREPVPRAVSGHMSYHVWGPEPGRGDVLITYDVPPAFLARYYREVEEVDRVVAPRARPFDSDQPVYLCRGPRAGGLAAAWPHLRRYRHRGPVASMGGSGASRFVHRASRPMANP